MRNANPSPRIDAGRLDRAVHLAAQDLGEGRYRITGGARPHRVDLSDPVHPHCDCIDHNKRGVECKHIIAARIVVRDPVVFAAALERVKSLTQH